MPSNMPRQPLLYPRYASPNNVFIGPQSPGIQKSSSCGNLLQSKKTDTNISSHNNDNLNLKDEYAISGKQIELPKVPHDSDSDSDIEKQNDMDKISISFRNHGNFKKQLEDKVKILKDKYSNANILIQTGEKFLKCILSSMDGNEREKIVQEMKKWTYRLYYKLKANEMKLVNEQKINLIKTCSN